MPPRRLSADEIGEMYRRHGPPLLLFVRPYVSDRAAAEDVLHRVFLRLLRNGYAVTENAPAYLYRAVKNEALNHQRSRWREATIPENETWFSCEAKTYPTEALALQSAIANLPGEQRDAVVMRVWGGMTFEEIAEATGVAVNTAASRYRYGLEKLRKAFEVSAGIGREEADGPR